MENNDNGKVSNLWRTFAVALFGILASGLTGYLLFGLDSVKHSEIPGIMATQAPWIYDKARVEEKINLNTRRIDELMMTKERIDRKETPLAKDVEQLKDRMDKMQQAIWELQSEQKRQPKP